jgi:hypothetical protein
MTARLEPNAGAVLPTFLREPVVGPLPPLHGRLEVARGDASPVSPNADVAFPCDSTLASRCAQSLARCCFRLLPQAEIAAERSAGTHGGCCAKVARRSGWELTLACPGTSGRAPCAAAVQAIPAGVVARQSLRRLWVAVISRHSERQAALPRRWKRSMLRLNLVSAKTGSIIAVRLR